MTYFSDYVDECVGGEMNIGAEGGIGKMSSNSKLVCCTYFHANSLEKAWTLSMKNKILYQSG